MWNYLMVIHKNLLACTIQRPSLDLCMYACVCACVCVHVTLCSHAYKYIQLTIHPKQCVMMCVYVCVCVCVCVCV